MILLILLSPIFLNIILHIFSLEYRLFVMILDMDLYYFSGIIYLINKWKDK